MPHRFAKTIVLGIDGLDPSLVTQYMAAGLMPHCAQLARNGSFMSLRPSLPPMSPVAWSDMAAGADAGQHGIFDFIHRRPADYVPYISIRQSRVGLLGTVYQPARRCDGFWRFTSDAAVPTTVIRWPVSFPPDRVTGRMLCGLGTPDLLGGEGRDTLYATRPPQSRKLELGPDHVVPVQWQGDEAGTQIEGPRTGKDSCATLDMTIRRRSTSSVELSISGGGAITATLGQWTPYVRLQFKAGLRRLQALSRFLLVEAAPELRLYQGPLQLDPVQPAFPISHPRAFSGELAASIGDFSTLGMPETVHPVTKGWFDHDALLSLCDAIDAERMRMLQVELGRFSEGLLAFVFDTSDRVQHAFWLTRGADPTAEGGRYADVIPALYRRMDAAVGRVLEVADDQTALWVVSDHGVGTFRRAVHLNRWLAENGYLHLRQAASDDGGLMFHDVDWTRTQAYALGFTSLYLNVKGREGGGIVAPGEEHDRLCDEIAAKLERLTDPANGDRVVRKVYRAAREYSGEAISGAPDLVVGLNLGYRLSWQTALGGTPAALIEDNADAWTGDHLFDPTLVPGVLLSNQKVTAETPRGIDVAATVLRCTGVPAPAHLKGKSLI